jgi:hypothetical protein
MTDKWFKDTYLCTNCDALIEVTRKGEATNISHCFIRSTLLSVQDATIQPNQTKEDKMEDTNYGATVTPAVPESYNPNLLVTYKVIRGYSDAEYATDKVTSIEWDLHNGRQSQKTVNTLQSKIDTVKDIILEAYTDSGDQETLALIAEALDIELTKSIEWTATIEVSGTIDLSLTEDYDLETEIMENLYVDSQSGNIEIGDTEVSYVREC